MVKKSLHELTNEELCVILQNEELETSGSKSDKLIRLEHYLQSKYGQSQDFDCSVLLDATPEDKTATLKDLHCLLKEMTIQIKEQQVKMEKRLEAIENKEKSVKDQREAAATNMVDHVQVQQECPYEPGEKGSKNLTLPSFWKHEPEVWFINAEERFNDYAVTCDRIKYHKVIDALDSSIISKISNIMRRPDRHKYSELKNQLIEMYKVHEETKINQVLKGFQLGDRKPSVLFREMQESACKKIDDDVLIQIWLEKLPLEVERNIRGLRKIVQPEKIPAIADGMLECSNIEVNAVMTRESKEKGTATCMDSILKDILDKLKSLEDRKQCNCREPRSRFRSSSRSRLRSRSPGDICWYHKTFKNKATRCIQPCNFDNNKNQENKTASH